MIVIFIKYELEEAKMRIAVVDGQGGGIGKALVEKMQKDLPNNIEIIALGTNAVAATLMMKSGAAACASGENAIIYNSTRVDIIVGAIGIIVSNSMLGELTPAMAKAISESPAKKILIPMNLCNIEIAGFNNELMNYFIESALEKIKKACYSKMECLTT
jgi:hypothetical protein